MFIESNPSPVKYAAKLMNLCDDAVRLPLVKTSENSQPVIKKALESAILILPSLIDFISDPLRTIPASKRSSKK